MPSQEKLPQHAENYAPEAEDLTLAGTEPRPLAAPAKAICHAGSHTVAVSVFPFSRAPFLVRFNSNGGTTVSLRLRTKRALTLYWALHNVIEYLQSVGVISPEEIAQTRLSNWK